MGKKEVLFPMSPEKTFFQSPAITSITFVPVDELPMNFSFGGSGRTNPMESQHFSVGVTSSRFSQLGQAPGSVFGTLPIHQDGGFRTNPNGGPPSTSNSLFDIKLVYEGNAVSQQVSERLPVVYLVYEASAIFGIDPDSIQLMLFSMVPTRLDSDS